MRTVLVDSRSADRALVHKILQSGGHEVLAFGDAREALAQVKSDPSVNAVVADADVVPLSAIEFCWEVRLIAGDHRPIYAMLIASAGDSQIMLEGLDAGIDDVIHKPLNERELQAKLRAGERLVTLQTKLIRLATVDSLTGLLNRRAFFERATKICDEAPLTGPVAAILLDIDYFKEVNDLYGHHTGDEALRAVSCEVAKNQAVAGRLGGDEICVLLDGHTQKDAWEFAQCLRARIADLPVKTSSGATNLTCSLGVAELGAGENIDDLVSSADLALYRAKREGRDRTATPPTPAWIEQNPRNVASVARESRRHAKTS